MQVCPQFAQGVEERLVFQLLWLENGEPFLLRILLDGAGLQDTAVPSDGFVGHRDDADHVISAFHKGTQALDRKVGRTHIDDSHIFFLHI